MANIVMAMLCRCHRVHRRNVRIHHRLCMSSLYSNSKSFDFSRTDLIAADLDNDGFEDLIMPQTGGSGPHACPILQNMQGARFRRIDCSVRLIWFREKPLNHMVVAARGLGLDRTTPGCRLALLSFRVANSDVAGSILACRTLIKMACST